MRGALLLVIVLAAHAHADDWHAGLNLRADSGAHPARLAGGIERGSLDVSAVLDPMVATDGLLDTDLYATWRVAGGGWGLLGGWRTSAIGIAGGHQLQEKLLLGLTGALPRLGCTPLRARWGFEMATVVVKHGADLPTDWISFGSPRDFGDLINVGMFVTVEYAGG